MTTGAVQTENDMCGAMPSSDSERSNQQCARFHYQPLNVDRREIRLLDVKEESDDNANILQCTIRHVSLNNSPKPEYETISYCWTDPTVRSTILLNGYTVDVPASAEKAIRRMRHTDKVRTLWIDAVCIHQDDVEERSNQVAIMGDVYGGSWRNLIWLGEYNGRKYNVMENLKRVLEDMRKETKDYELLFSVLFNKKRRPRYSSITTIADLDHESLVWLYSRPWFERLWVLQEAVLSPRSICYIDKHVLPLIDILRAAVWLRHRRIYPKGTFQVNAIAIWYLKEPGTGEEAGSFRQDTDEGLTLCTLRNQSYNFRASDPRDLIYGLLGLAGRDGDLQLRKQCPLRPNYEKTVEEVFRDAVEAMVVPLGELDALREVEYYSNAELDAIPISWVPRWDRSRDPAYSAMPLDYFFAPDGKSKILRTGAVVDGNTLSVNGLSLGSISVVSDLLTYKDLDQGKAWKHSIANFKASLRETEAFVIAALRTTLINETGHDGSPATPQDVQDFESYKKYTETHEESRLSSPHMLDENVDEDTHAASRYFWSMRPVCNNRRLFCTSAGLIGLGPRILQENDLACILAGLPWPAILRPLDHSPGKFRFIGHGHVAGVMNGDFVRRIEQSDRLRTFMTRFTIV